MTDYQQTTGYDWDAPISNDSAAFEVLPAGDYDFTIAAVERAWHNGSDKLPPCNKALVSVQVTGNGRSAMIKHNLFLHPKCEGMLCEFFTAVGARKRGETISMNWSAVAGATGRCKVGVREWTGRDGEKMTSNEIKRFYEPATATATAWKEGNF